MVIGRSRGDRCVLMLLEFASSGCQRKCMFFSEELYLHLRLLMEFPGENVPELVWMLRYGNLPIDGKFSVGIYQMCAYFLNYKSHKMFIVEISFNCVKKMYIAYIKKMGKKSLKLCF